MVLQLVQDWDKEGSSLTWTSTSLGLLGQRATSTMRGKGWKCNYNPHTKEKWSSETCRSWPYKERRCWQKFFRTDWETGTTCGLCVMKKVRKQQNMDPKTQIIRQKTYHRYQIFTSQRRRDTFPLNRRRDFVPFLSDTSQQWRDQAFQSQSRSPGTFSNPRPGSFPPSACFLGQQQQCLWTGCCLGLPFGHTDCRMKNMYGEI